jgi:hypothetical protein
MYSLAKWGGAISVLDSVSKSYAQIMAYKTETKKLEVEITKINRQAEMAKNVIDKQFFYEMQKLKDKQSSILIGLKLAHQELGGLRIRKQDIQNMREAYHQQILNPNVSFKEKKMYGNLIIQLGKELKSLSKDSYLTFSKMVESTQHKAESLALNHNQLSLGN